ncbi:hypothetical protein CPB83DRAFT_763733 [Crepidotus variabilis]|uniref:Uncharacterized protein n=1 Tax=Crepidotus variabilis TaxID=179855 RepID=A0A9P6JS00_9AGAR|nr:hypothetical protein CPB83DRAFT_763733 [Crepidotus variabilis]
MALAPPKRVRANTGSLAPPPSAFTFHPTHSNASTFRTLQLEVQLSSPSLKVGGPIRKPLPVYSDNDAIAGKISLENISYHSGRILLTVEGAFHHRLPKAQDEPVASGSFVPPRKHVFFSSTKLISVTNPEVASPRSVFRREGNILKRRPSVSSIEENKRALTPKRCYPFSFELPRGLRSGEELPATYPSTQFPSSPSVSTASHIEVSYRIVADWEPSDQQEQSSHLEIPFVIQPDAEFQCADATIPSDKMWLEMPLKSDRPIPVRCAMTLPTSMSFARSSSIPYFVVFTTTPRSPELAREIASDATISVSLIRQITVNEQASLPPTPPLTPTSDDSDGPSSARPKILRLVHKGSARFQRHRWPSDSSLALSHDKHETQSGLGTKHFSDLRTIHHDMSLGFPKRPRQQYDKKGNHPSLETIASLPDGLHKTRIPLSGDLLPSLDWRGLTVKYYLDVAVLLGPDDFRARVPIRIT